MDPEEERVYLSPGDLDTYLNCLQVHEGEPRSQILGALRGVAPRGPAISRLEEAAGRVERGEAVAAALTLLRHLGPPGTAVLFRLAVESPRWQTRASALDVIGETSPGHSCFVTAPTWESYVVDAREAAVRAIGDAHPSVRTAALEALTSLWPPDMAISSAVLAALSDQDPKVRASSVRLIRHAGRLEAEVPEQIHPLLSDPDEEVRLEAATLISKTREHADAAIPVLVSLLQSGRAARRAQAARALGRYGSKAAAAVPALARLLHPSDGDEARDYLGAIAEIGPPAAPLVSEIVELTKAKSSPLDEAFGALSRLGVPAVPALIELLGHEDDERRYRSARALRDLGDVAAPALPGLWNAMTDPVARVRFRAAQAILHVDPSSTSGLIKYLLSRDDFDRSHLLHYLAEEKDRALPLLREAASKLSEDQKAQVLKHIEQITHPNPG